MEIAAATAAAQTELASTQAAESTSTFDREGFLSLLVAQLQNQDPLEPMSNEQFMSQMSQFTMVEEMQNMSSSFDAFTKTNMITASATLVGKEVTLEKNGQTETGLVDKIRYVNDEVELLVNGQWRDMTELSAVAEPTTTSATL